MLLELLVSNVACAGLLAVAALGVTSVWRNPQLGHVLWLLVLVKLLTPPIFRVPLPRWPSPAETKCAAVAAGDKPTSAAPPAGPPIAFDDPRDDAPDNRPPGPLLIPPSSEYADDGLSPGAEADRTPAGPARSAPAGIARSTPPKIAPQASRGDPWRAALWPLLLGSWGAGSLAFALLAGRRHRRMRGIVARARAADGAITESAERLARRMGLRRDPPVLITEERVSPLVCLRGWRPVILLPSGLLRELTKEQQETVLAHELAHICRRDWLVRWLEAAALLIHWWNPLAWLTVRRLRRAEEECCDAWVVWALPESRRSYGRALLSTVEYLTERPPVLAAGSMFGAFLFKRRIEMILKQKLQRKMSPAMWVTVILLGAAALPLSAYLAAPAAAQPATERPEDAASIVNEEPTFDTAAEEDSKLHAKDGEGARRQDEKAYRARVEERLLRLEQLVAGLVRNHEPATDQGVGTAEDAADLDLIPLSALEKERNALLNKLRALETRMREMEEGRARELSPTFEGTKLPTPAAAAAQQRLLELDVKSAMLKLEAARAKTNRIEQLRGRGLVSETESEALRLEAAQAELELERTQTLLELYRAQHDEGAR